MKCYRAVLNKPMCVSVHLGKSWSKERPCLEVKPFKSTWGKFVVLRRNEERHLFNTKPNVMLTYTSNGKSALSQEGNLYRYQTHTHTRHRQPYIIYISTHNDMHLPDIYTHTDRAGFTGYSSCCFPDQTMAALLQAWQARLCQGRERETKKEREKEREQTER